jgi:hypothetical protein
MFTKQILLLLLLFISRHATATYHEQYPYEIHSPMGTYYVTDSGGSIWSIGPSKDGIFDMRVTYFNQNTTVYGNEGPVAVNPPGIIKGREIQTMGANPGSNGSTYIYPPYPVLTPTGTSHTNTTDEYFMDGTSDRHFNYSVSYLTGPHAGMVYRFDQEWGNPEPIFYTGNIYSNGITYDRFTDSLWVLETVGPPLSYAALNRFENFDLSGHLLKSFDIWTETPLRALAMGEAYQLWAVGSRSFLDSSLVSLYTISPYTHVPEGQDYYLKPDYVMVPMQNPLGGEIKSVCFYSNNHCWIPELDALSGTGALSILGFALALAGERRRGK